MHTTWVLQRRSQVFWVLNYGRPIELSYIIDHQNVVKFAANSLEQGIYARHAGQSSTYLSDVSDI